WGRPAEHPPCDPSRTLLIDDSRAVLDAAAAYGIEYLLTVQQPDSARPSRKELAFPAFNDFGELMPGG
ncbi:MAG: haloacid dehalogenase, partial [Gammaproteobacteria bacterium]|nr:haloacid dehalogenase [Gammaproteobacteria bacterium]